MKNVLKALLPVAFCAATAAHATAAPTCGGHGVGSYYINSVANGAKVAITLSGYGAAKLPNKDLTGDVAIGQDFNLNADCSFSSYIYGVDTNGRSDLYKITGTWSYPAESKVIYIMMDGDVSAGDKVADPEATTWGRLLAGGLSISNVMPIIFKTKMATSGDGGFTTIFPSVTVKSFFIKPSADGSTAVATMSITGKGIAKDLKGGTKEATFGFGSVSKATVVNNPM